MSVEVGEFHASYRHAVYNIFMKFIIGVDEVGRGPLAGPVSVGVFTAEQRFEKWLLKNLFQNNLRDSKKLSPPHRVAIYRYILKLKKEGKVNFNVVHVSNKIIDQKGLSFAINSAIKKNLLFLKNPLSQIRLDGGLKAPAQFKNQKTIIKGDEKDVFIACASIVAKVSRDRLMCRFASRFPNYSLEIHKCYGTLKHRKLIQRYGLSDLHRVTFCTRLNSK